MKIRTLFKLLESEIFPPGPDFAPDPGDVMLVSYPKSGNTWVRALVSNLVKPGASLLEMERIVPDIYKARGHVLRRAHRFPCGGRLIKSHECFRPTYRRVIYILRDPRDVCISYYHYLKKIQGKTNLNDKTLEEFVPIFLSGKTDSFGTWAEHIRSWQSAEEADMLFIRYEDLLSDAKASLKRICDFLHIEVSEEIASAAISECSINALRKKEKKERRSWLATKNADSTGRFFRAGKSNNWSELNKKMIDAMNYKWIKEIENSGYKVYS